MPLTALKPLVEPPDPVERQIFTELENYLFPPQPLRTSVCFSALLKTSLNENKRMTELMIGRGLI